MTTTHTSVAYHAQTPQSISPLSQPSPRTSHFHNVAPRGPFYHHPPPYNPYSLPDPYPHHPSISSTYSSHPYSHPPLPRPSLISRFSSPELGSSKQERIGSSFSATGNKPSHSPPMTDELYQQRPDSSPARSGVANTGPIRAAGPVIPKKDAEGVPWIAVEYTKDRSVKSHLIRIDTETVDVDALPYEFKLKNVIYPAVFKGARRTREKYETDCNRTAWALAELNPCLREAKGLRQRAVDHWRNCNDDRSKASRRVRRDAKKARRNAGANMRSQLETEADMTAVVNVVDMKMEEVDHRPRSFPLQDSSHPMDSRQYMPLNSAHQSTYGDLTATDSKSHSRNFPSPIMNPPSALPPTPETMDNDEHSDSPHHGHIATSTPFIAQVAPEHYNTPTLPSHRGLVGPDRHGSDHYRVNFPVDGIHEHYHGGSSYDRVHVFPRAIKTSRDDVPHTDGEPDSITRTSVRIGLGLSFDGMIAIPNASVAQQEQDRYWNERAEDLVKTQYPELRARPQQIQRVLTRIYRKGERKPSSAVNLSAGRQNRPTLHQ